MWGYVVAGSLAILYLMSDNINISDIFQKANIKIHDNNTATTNQKEKWDIVIHNKKAYNDFMSGCLGFMESYMKGYWSCDDLEQLFRQIEEANLHDINIYTYSQLISLGLSRLKIKLLGFNEKDGQLVGAQHYDLPIELYETMLGPSMIYSCAYFKNTDNLDVAQAKKMDLIARKMKLQPGMTILDIGCGWGSLGYFLVNRYKVKVIGISISKNQIKYCRENFQHDNLVFNLEDYRNTKGSFDRIVSVGMFEHVTSVNYDTYFSVCQKILKPGGLFLLHTITGDKSHYPGGGNPFIMKYIFPNSQLPSLSQITKAVSYKFVVEDVQNFGLYYAKTLKEWRNNFDIDEINNKLMENSKPPLTNSFIRMWKAYLIMSQIGFEKNRIFLHQFVLSKSGKFDKVYEAVR